MGHKPKSNADGNKTKQVNPLSRGCPLFRLPRGGSGRVWCITINDAKKQDGKGRENATENEGHLRVFRSLKKIASWGILTHCFSNLDEPLDLGILK